MTGNIGAQGANARWLRRERFLDLVAPDQPLSIPELPRFSEPSDDST
jgi:hypothetical protein